MKQDSSWRKILDKLLPEFLAFYFPEIHAAIDFSKGFVFPDKELQKILSKETDKGNNRERYQWKKHFILELYRRGLTRDPEASGSRSMSSSTL
jgi:hypothetical protein